MLDPAAAEDSSCRQLVQAVVEQPDRGCFYAFNSTLIKISVKVFIFCLNHGVFQVVIEQPVSQGRGRMSLEIKKK